MILNTLDFLLYGHSNFSGVTLGYNYATGSIGREQGPWVSEVFTMFQSDESSGI